MNKGDLRKVERYLHRDLEYLMREGKILVDLKEDVEKIKGLLEKAKESKRATLLLAYYTRDARKEEKLSERIERRLNSWIERLEGLLSKTYLIASNDDKEQLKKLRSHIDICKNNLARILAWNGELHTAIQGEDWNEAETKISEAMGNRTSPGIRSLIVILEHMEEVEKKNRILIELDDPFKMFKALKGNPHLFEVTEFLDRLDTLILEGDYDLEEILKMIERWEGLRKLHNIDVECTYILKGIIAKFAYLLFGVNKKVIRTSKDMWDDNQFDLSNTGNKEKLIQFFDYLMISRFPPWMSRTDQYITPILNQKETIREIAAETGFECDNYLNLERKAGSRNTFYYDYNGQVVLAFLIYLVKSKNLPKIITKFLIFCFVNIDKVLVNLYGGNKRVFTEVRDTFFDGLIEVGLFKDLVVSEIGGYLYNSIWYEFKRFDYLKKNPSLCGISQTGPEATDGRHHTSVNQGERVELSTWEENYPLPADFSLSGRVISYGSGMSYDGHPGTYCAMELLACFANMTKKGGYSIHFVEMGSQIINPLFLDFIGFELVERIKEDLIVLKKLNNKKVSKEQFERWFNANMERYGDSKDSYVLKGEQ